MEYFGQSIDVANRSNKIGVLLLNLGTPERATTSALRKYLGEFLMDPRVIELPKFFRFLLVKGIIVNFRSSKSVANYKKVWTDEGSPLMFNSQRLTEQVAEELGNDYIVELAMRYGEPSIEQKFTVLHERGVRSIIALPLYPQYSGSTSGSTFDQISNVLRKQRWIPNLNFVNGYYHRQSYIQAIGDSIQSYWNENGRAQKLLMSFHGVPQKYIAKGDPYFAQCQESANKIANYLNLQQDQWMLVFQSRFGSEQWLQPYCDQTLKELPDNGIRSVDIICPGFSVDCLETLEEIQQENRDYFMRAGGTKYFYIPCLNDSEAQVELISEIVRGFDVIS